MITHIVIPYLPHKGINHRGYPELFKTLRDAEECYENYRAQNMTVELIEIVPNTTHVSLVMSYEAK